MTGCRAAAGHAPAVAVTSLPDWPAAPLRCTVPASGGGTLTLRLHRDPYAGYPATCAQLAQVVHVPPQPGPDDVAVAQEALRRLDFFDQVQCALGPPTEGLACTLWPAAIVRDVHIGGHVPFALFSDDLRRRLSLRPGTVLHDVPGQLEAQARRLTAYLHQEGYFDAAVAITPRPAPGGAPHRAVHLDVAVSARAEARVRKVTLLGAPRIATEKLAGPLFHRGPFGYAARFRPAQLGEDVEGLQARLHRAGYVAARLSADYRTDAAAGAVDVDLKVRAGPKVRLRVEGARALPLRTLRQLMPFADDNAVDSVAVESFRVAVVHALQARGYPYAEVQASLRRDVAPHARVVTLAMNPGPQSFLREITLRYVGNASAAHLSLARELSLRPSGRGRRRAWTERAAKADVQALRRRLLAEGYLDAKVHAERDVARGGGLALRYVVEAGVRHVVGTVRLFGVSDAQLARRLLAAAALRCGQPLAPDAEDHAAQALQLALSQRGYVDGEVSTTDEVREADGHRVHDVQLDVHPGVQAVFEGLWIRGNFRSRPQSVRQQMGLRVRRPLNLSQLGAAKRALRTSGLFDAVTLVPHKAAPTDPNTFLLLTLEERDGRSVDGVAAYSSDFRFALGADWQDGNLFGRAIFARLTARVSDAQNTVPHLRIGDQDLLEAQLRAPQPWGLPVTVDGSVQYRYQDVTLFRERRFGGQAAVGRVAWPLGHCRLCPSVALRLAYELNEAYREYKDDARPSYKDATIARLVPSLGLDARDQATDPRRGYNLDVRLEGAHPVLAGVLDARASSFWRLLVGLQGFVPLGTPLQVPLSPGHALGGPVVLAVALSYGGAGPYGHRGAVPPSETYGYGGDLSVRGLRNRASSRVLDNPDYLLTVSCELRWYVVQNFGFGSVQLAGFVDFGDVAADFGALGRHGTVSAGPALRYVTPIGPLSLAYGRAVSLPKALRHAPDAAPPRGRIHFTFGYTF